MQQAENRRQERQWEGRERRAQAGGDGRGDAGHAAQPGREPVRGGARRPQHGHGAGALLRSAGGAGSARGSVAHYGNELRLVAAASRRLVEKLVALDAHAAPDGAARLSSSSSGRGHGRARAGAERGLREPPKPAASKLEAGRRRTVRTGTGAGICCPPCRSPTWPPSCWPTATCSRRWPALDRADHGGRWRRAAGAAHRRGPDPGAGEPGQERRRGHAGRAGASTSACASAPAAGRRPTCLALTIEDNGPGIPEEALEKIFASGYTTRGKERSGKRRERRLAASHRGLGLAITRSIVEGGGRAHHGREPRRRAERASRSSCRCGKDSSLEPAGSGERCGKQLDRTDSARIAVSWQADS